MNEVEEGVNKGYDLISGKLRLWMHDLIEMLPNFIVALLMVLLFLVMARTLMRLTVNILGKVSTNTAINKLIGSAIYFIILLVGIFVALGILNLDKTVTSLLAGAGIIGLVLGFAFQDIAANFASGILIALRKPFYPGDFVLTGTTLGTVELLNLHTTSFKTQQGQMVTIPNKQVFQNPIINYSTYGKRRIDLHVNVAFSADLDLVEKVTIEAVQKIAQLDKTREIELFFTEFGLSAIVVEVRFWIAFTNKQTDYLKAQSDAIRNIRSAFDKHDIVIPFPVRTVVLRENGMGFTTEKT